MKKNKLLLAIFFSLLLFTTYSCQVEELDATPTAITTDGATRKIDPQFLTHKFSNKKIKPLWKSAIAFDNTNAVEVNFTIDKKYYRPLSENKKVVGRQRILLTFDKEGKVKETIIEYIPSNDFTGDIRKINSGNFKNNFEGKVTLTSLGKESKTAWTVSNNKIIQKASLTKTNPLRSSTSKTSEEVCSSVYKCTDYQLSFDDCPPSEACVVDAQNECWWEFVCYDNPEQPTEYDPFNCDDNPGSPWCVGDGSGDGGGTDPSDPGNNENNTDDNPPSCESFNFTAKQGANWQEALVKNIQFKVVIIDNRGITLNHLVSFPQGVLFGIAISFNQGGPDVTPGAAATVSAIVLNKVMGSIEAKYARTSTSDLILTTEFKRLLIDEYRIYTRGGTVNFNSTSALPATNYKTNPRETGICD